MSAHPSPKSPLFRSSRRITITVPYHAFQVLQERSDQEGRSLSNLAAYLLESSIERFQVSPIQRIQPELNIGHRFSEIRRGDPAAETPQRSVVTAAFI